jgi:hypothetical protein
MPVDDKASALNMKGDLDKDGKMSGYEAKRQAAIDKNMESFIRAIKRRRR